MADEFRVIPLKKIPQQASSTPTTKRLARVWPVRPGKLLWVPIIAGLWWAVEVYGTPHLRFAAKWTGEPSHKIYLECDYVGWHSRRIHPRSGECPLIRLLRAEAEDAR